MTNGLHFHEQSSSFCGAWGIEIVTRTNKTDQVLAGVGGIGDNKLRAASQETGITESMQMTTTKRNGIHLGAFLTN
jgi:hypothetical protein